MAIEWKVPIPENYTLEPTDTNGFPRDELKEEIKRRLSQIPRNRVRYQNESLLDSDTNWRSNIVKETFEYCCESGYSIPVPGMEVVSTKYDFLIQLFKLGNSTRITELSPELKDIILCGENLNKEEFLKSSYFNFFKNNVLRFTFNVLTSTIPEDENIEAEEISGKYVESICNKEILDFLNYGFSIEIKFTSFDLDNREELYPINLGYRIGDNPPPLNLQIRFNEITQRYAKVIRINENKIEAVKGKVSLSLEGEAKFYLPEQIAINQNENQLFKCLLDKNNKDSLHYLTPSKKTPKKMTTNLFGFFQKTYENTYKDIVGDKFSRKISSDERIYHYSNPKDFKPDSTKYIIYSIKVEGKNEIEDSYYFDYTIQQQIDETIKKIHDKTKISLELIERDIKKLIENPPHEKNRRIKPGMEQEYKRISIKIANAIHSEFAVMLNDNVIIELLRRIDEEIGKGDETFLFFYLIFENKETLLSKKEEDEIKDIIMQQLNIEEETYITYKQRYTLLKEIGEMQ